MIINNTTAHYVSVSGPVVHIGYGLQSTLLGEATLCGLWGEPIKPLSDDVTDTALEALICRNCKRTK